MSNLTSDPQGAGQPLYSSSTTPVHALGERLVTSDGRVFRYARAGAVTLVNGNWLQAPAVVPTHLTLAPTANTAIGATTLTFTLGAVAATANQYAGGWAVVASGPGIGQMLAITGHPAANALATLTVTLGDPVQVALTLASSKVDLIANPYNGVIQAPITTLTGTVAGVCAFAIPATEYGWVQRGGPAAALVAGTSIVGSALVVPSTAAGTAIIDGGTSGPTFVGTLMTAALDANTKAVMLALE